MIIASFEFVHAYVRACMRMLASVRVAPARAGIYVYAQWHRQCACINVATVTTSPQAKSLNSMSKYIVTIVRKQPFGGNSVALLPEQRTPTRVCK